MLLLVIVDVVDCVFVCVILWLVVLIFFECSPVFTNDWFTCAYHDGLPLTRYRRGDPTGRCAQMFAYNSPLPHQLDAESLPAADAQKGGSPAGRVVCVPRCATRYLLKW